MDASVAGQMTAQPGDEGRGILKLTGSIQSRRPSGEKANTNPAVLDELPGFKRQRVLSRIIGGEDLGLHLPGIEGLAHGKHSLAWPATTGGHGRDDVQDLHAGLLKDMSIVIHR